MRTFEITLYKYDELPAGSKKFALQFYKQQNETKKECIKRLRETGFEFFFDGHIYQDINILYNLCAMHNMGLRNINNPLNL